MTEAHRNESPEAADLATLSWCIGEIRESLAACEHGLQACLQDTHGESVAAPEERPGLAAARAALPQAPGALAVVDLAGVTTVTGEAETVLERVAGGQLALDEPLIATFARAFAAIPEYLAELPPAPGAMGVAALAGVPTGTGEAEPVPGAVARGQLALDEPLIAAFARAFAAILEYLDELLLGEPQQPLYLFPYYASLLELR